MMRAECPKNGRDLDIGIDDLKSVIPNKVRKIEPRIDLKGVAAAVRSKIEHGWTHLATIR